eukprot:6178708-Pleurochrysis_carterae.AAC.1
MGSDAKSGAEASPAPEGAATATGRPHAIALARASAPEAAEGRKGARRGHTPGRGSATTTEGAATSVGETPRRNRSAPRC